MTIHRLEPRREPEPIEEIDPLARGSLVHQVQFELLGQLAAEGLLPVTPARLPEARARLEATLARTAARYRDELQPAIDRVWDDGIAGIKADLLEWLRRQGDERRWVPWRFELAFGLAGARGAERDPTSRPEAVPLPTGIALRGSIDLVERDAGGALRATDYKTGVARAFPGTVIGGGRTLQPVLYALALEQLFPGQPVAGGRLSYCTSKGGFTDVDIPLDDEARAAAGELTRTLEHHLAEAFLPAAPEEGACEYCDYLAVCGTGEELRVRRKPADKLVRLRKLRESP